MDSKRLRQADAESILLNPVFKDAVLEYENIWKAKALNCKTPDEAYRTVLAVQASQEFIRILQNYINDGIIETHNEEMKNRYVEPTGIRKIVR